MNFTFGSYLRVTEQDHLVTHLITSTFILSNIPLFPNLLTGIGIRLDPGTTGTPVIKSLVMNGRSTTDLWHEGSLCA